MDKTDRREPLTAEGAQALLESLYVPSQPAAPRAGSLPKVTFPPDWKMRSVHVPGHFKTYEVPRYIVRIDIDEPGMTGTHGWQVRYQTETYGSRLVSDSKFDCGGRKGTPSDSLHAAKVYLAAIWVGTPRRPLLPENPHRKHHPTGMTGVRVTWRERGGKMQCHVRVDDLQGKPLHHMYVGTEPSVSESKLAAKVAEGRKRRCAYLKSIGQLERLPATGGR